MNKEEIKMRLAGYRPELYQDDDPEIAEALRLAKADPELRAWLENEMSFDRDLSESLQCLPPDQAAIDTLLAKENETRIRRVFSRPVLLAAAALVMFGGVALKHLLFPAPVDFPATTQAASTDFRTQMAYFATQRFSLDRTTADLEEARSWLAGQTLPVYPATPVGISPFPAMGCKEIDWHGCKVALLCFVNGEDDIVHIFMIRKEDLGDGIGETWGEMARHHDRETLGWQDDENAYLLVGSEPNVSLAGIL